VSVNYSQIEKHSSNSGDSLLALALLPTLAAKQQVEILALLLGDPDLALSLTKVAPDHRDHLPATSCDLSSLQAQA
jgi:hypothetical protein